MSVVGKENITIKKIPRWESELWSYISSGDGVNCPLHDACQTRRHDGWCFDDKKGMFNGLYGTHAIDSSSDEDELDVFRSLFEHNFPQRWIPGRTFQLVEALSNKYIGKVKLNQPPVTTELI